MALLQPQHLSAVTDFEDQHPVLTYDLLTLPQYGTLQRYETGSDWVDLVNSTGLHTSPFGDAPPTFFTQEDVNRGHVRYVQSEPLDLYTETFQFRLRSYNFSGPEGSFCVSIFPTGLLLQPTIDVDLVPLVVEEGASAAINHSVLNTSLAELVMQPGLEIDIQQLDVVYTLVDPPSYGDLHLMGDILVAGDVFAHHHVTSSALVYVHGGSEAHSDQFSFYGDATSVQYLPLRAPNRTSNLTLLIDITPVNDNRPVLEIMEPIRPPEGCWVPVTAANVNVTDADRPLERLRIYLRKKGATPTGRFALRSDPDSAIPQFFMEDVLAENVIFVHQLNASLEYTQVLRVDDGNSSHTIREVQQ